MHFKHGKQVRTRRRRRHLEFLESRRVLADIVGFSFEEAGEYSASVVEFATVDQGYFTRTDDAVIGGSSIEGIEGTHYLAAENTDDLGAGTIVVDFESINTYAYGELEVSLLLGTADPQGAENWDSDSRLRLQFESDEGFVDFLSVAGTGVDSTPRVDLNLDGIGDGAPLGETLQRISAPLPEHLTTLRLRLLIENLDDVGEDIAIDDLRVSGTPSTVRLNQLDSRPTSAGETVELSPDGRFMVINRQSQGLFSLDLTTNTERMLSPLEGATRVSAGDTGATFEISPDSRYVVFGLIDDVYSVPIEGGPVTQLSTSRDVFSLGNAPRFRISPNGETVVYATNQTHYNTVDLYAAAIDGGYTRRLSLPSFVHLHNHFEIGSFEFTPDGSGVIILDQYLGGQLYLAPLDGSPAVDLSGPVQRVSYAMLNRVGSHAIFQGQLENGVDSYFAVDLLGSPPTRLDMPEESFRADQFVADDERLILAYRSHLMSIPFDGSPMEQIAELPAGGLRSLEMVGDHVVLSLYVQEERQLNLYSISLVDGVVNRLSDDHGIGEYLVHLDTGQIAFTSESLLYQTTVEAGEPRLLSDLRVRNIGDEYNDYQSIYASPDWTSVVFTIFTGDVPRGELYRVPLDGGEAVPFGLSGFGGRVHDLHPLGDGRQVVVRGGFRNISNLAALYLADLDTRETLPLGEVLEQQRERIDNVTRVAIDGVEHILFSQEDDHERRSIWVAPIVGGSSVNLTPAFDDVAFIELSQSGSHVVVAAESAYYRIPVSGGAPELLAEFPASFRRISHAPEHPPGFRLLTLNNGPFDQEFMLINLDSGEVIRHSLPMDFDGLIFNYLISEDQEYIVYSANFETSDRLELFSLEMRTGRVEKLNNDQTNGPIRNYKISPDASTVVYVGEHSEEERPAVYAVPITGGMSRHLDTELPVHPFSDDLFISADSQSLIYPSGRGFAIEGWNHVPLDASAPPQPMPSYAGSLVFVRGDVIFRSDESPAGLYQYSLSNGQTTRLDTPVNQGAGVSNFILDESGERVLFLQDVRGEGLFDLFDVPVGGGQVTQINQELGDGAVTDVLYIDGYLSYSTDDARYLLPGDGSPEVRVEGQLVPTYISRDLTRTIRGSRSMPIAGDTLTPQVVSVTPQQQRITDMHENETITVAVRYNKDMQHFRNEFPSVDLVYNNDLTVRELTLLDKIWEDSRTLLATFVVNELKKDIDSIDIRVRGGVDLGGMEPEPFDAIGALAIDRNDVTLRVNQLLVDPPVIDGRPLPTTWASQRSELRDVTLEYEHSIRVDLSNVTLTHLGLAPGIDAETTIELRADQFVHEPGSTAFTLLFADDDLVDGSYRIDVRDVTRSNGEGVADYSVSGNSNSKLFVLQGDFNGDGGNSVFDIVPFAYWFGVPVGPGGAPEYLEMVEDGGISIFDFGVWSGLFNNSVAVTTSPTANPDRLQVEAGADIHIDVLGNDIGGDDLRIVPDSIFVDRGLATLEAGHIRYAAPRDVAAGGETATIQYTVRDQFGLTDSASVTLQLEEWRPIVALDDFIQVPIEIIESQILQTTLGQNFGNGMDWNAAGRDPRIISTSQLSDGGRLQLPIIEPTIRTGTVTFTYTLSDTQGNTDEATVTIEILERELV